MGLPVACDDECLILGYVVDVLKEEKTDALKILFDSKNVHLRNATDRELSKWMDLVSTHPNLSYDVDFDEYDDE